jgi:hypothetical protein
MRILNKEEFLALPVGVIYCCNRDRHHVGFSDLRIKDETVSASDWFEVTLTQYEHNDTGELCDRHDEMLAGKSYPLEISACRNGLFEEENIFLVYEASDIAKLIIQLEGCIGCDQV